MKERPIIFDAKSVRAILKGDKDQTRRVIKPSWRPETDRAYLAASPERAAAQNPYGKPGDRLWVRETWATVWPDTTDNGMIYDEEDGHVRPVRDDECSIEYRADTGNALPGDWPAEDRDHPDAPRWRSPIYMPRWASRLTLEVEAVYVERLQDIDDGDACGEGFEGIFGDEDPYSSIPVVSPVWQFEERWNEINAKRGYPWESNPWVWVVEFRLLKRYKYQGRELLL